MSGKKDCHWIKASRPVRANTSVSSDSSSVNAAARNGSGEVSAASSRYAGKINLSAKTNKTLGAYKEPSQRTGSRAARAFARRSSAVISVVFEATASVTYVQS